MKKLVIYLILMFCIILVITGCVKEPVDKNVKPNVYDDRVTVAVSILPQAYFVESIGGDKVQVSVMIPPGANPATYEPTPSQLKSLSDADLYIKIGHVPFEKTWMQRLISANKNMKIIDSSEDINIIENDPHIWLSPVLVKKQANSIFKGLVEIDPENRDYYAQNLAAFLKELDDLDAEIRNNLSGVENKKFMVFHPSWGYFAREYGLEQISIEVEGKEPSAEDLVKLVEKARSNNIKVIFASPQFSSKSAQVIAKELNGRVIFVDSLSRDYKNNLRVISETFAQVLK